MDNRIFSRYKYTIILSAAILISTLYIIPVLSRSLKVLSLYNGLQSVIYGNKETLKNSYKIESSAVLVPGNKTVIHAKLFQKRSAKSKCPIIIVHDSDPAGMNEPVATSFAHTLSSMGFQVTVPELNGMKSLKLNTSDILTVASTIRYIHETTGRKVAVIGIGLGTGAAFISSSMPDTIDKISLLFLLNGYCDLKNVIIRLIGSDMHDNIIKPFSLPGSQAKWAFFSLNIGLLPLPEDQLAMQEIIKKKLYSPDSDIDEYLMSLSSEGIALYNLINNNDQNYPEALLEELPNPFKSILRELSPVNFINGNPENIFILYAHGYNIIPLEESKNLLKELDRSSAQTFPATAFTQIRKSPVFAEKKSFFKFLYRFIRIAEES